VLPVQSERDATLFVNLVEHPVGVILHGCSEDHNLVDFAHLFQKLVAARAHSEATLPCRFIIVDERLVQVEHQGISVLLRLFQVGCLDCLQLLVTADGGATHAVEAELLGRHF